MKQNLPISNKERDYAETANILSTTDLKGAITYYNDDFLAISGFEPEELMHNNHNVVRHPEMPPAAFEDLWKTIKDGNSWMGIVKNRCKNGDHYWVDAYVTPIRSNGQIVEYQSVRQKPAREYVNRAEKIYKSLLAGQLPKEISPSRFSIGTRIIAAVTSSLLVSFLLLTLLFDVEASSAIAGFSISAILASLLASLVLRPLKSAIEKAKCITDNPITRYVYTGRNDDVGALLLAIKSLGSEIGGFIGRISDDSKKLSECAETLSETIETSNQGVQQQYSETDQVATAINEMSVSIQEVASNAQLTADAASHATAESESGMDIVKSTTSSIEELANGLEQASGVIAKVETDSAEISSIVDVIRSISEQTNLLALNAAIEAARAGEYGRGFAVVADEVRNLAGRTNSATGEIQNMIEQLQSGTSKAVSVMSKSREQAVNSVKQANSAAQSLESITNAIININDMSMTIASAVEEQSAVAEDINRSITTIRDTAENTMRGSLQTEEAGTAMANLARSLKELADEFWTKKSNC